MQQIKKTILIIAGVCVSSTALAGGYRVALQGQKALGMGHTGVAMTESAEVVFFNPASMSFLESDSSISAGITLIESEAKYQNQQTNTTAKTDNPIGTPISFYYTKKYDDKISYGLGIYTPYGNAVEWEKDWAGSHLVNDIELAAIYIQPTISYKINDTYSVGFGINYVTGAVKFNRNLDRTLSDANGNRSNVTIEETKISAWGYNVGFTAKPTEELNVGISYRSQVDMEARGGEADFQNVPSSFPSDLSDTTFDSDLVLPAELTLGVAYELSPETVLAFDLNRTFWGAYESLNVQFNNDAGLSKNPRNYKDVNIFRFGVQHKLNEKFVVRGGVYFDESPIQEGYYTPETPRNDSIGYTAGATYTMSEKMELDFSFLYLAFDEFYGSYDYYVDSTGTTVPFGGDYKSSVVSLGFGLNYIF